MEFGFDWPSGFRGFSSDKFKDYTDTMGKNSCCELVSPASDFENGGYMGDICKRRHAN